MLSKIKNDIISYPAAIVGFIGAVLSYAVSQHLLTLSTDQTAVVMAAVTAALGVLTALLTDKVTYSVVIGFGTALSALILGFDTSLNAKHAAAIIAGIVFILGLLNHATNSPRYGTKGTRAATVAAQPEPATETAAAEPVETPAGG